MDVIVRVCVYTYVHIITCRYTYIYIYMCKCIYIYTYTYIHIYICIYVCIYIYIYIYVCVYIYTCVYICIHIHIYIYIGLHSMYHIQDCICIIGSVGLCFLIDKTKRRAWRKQKPWRIYTRPKSKEGNSTRTQISCRVLGPRPPSGMGELGDHVSLPLSRGLPDRLTSWWRSRRSFWPCQRCAALGLRTVRGQIKCCSVLQFSTILSLFTRSFLPRHVNWGRQPKARSSELRLRVFLVPSTPFAHAWAVSRATEAIWAVWASENSKILLTLDLASFGLFCLKEEGLQGPLDFSGS